MKIIVCLKVLCLVACFSLASNAFGGEVIYKIGSYTFNVPKENVPDLSPWGWIKSVAGLDEDVDSFIFEFSGVEVQSDIKDYVAKKGPIDQKVIGAMYHTNDVERKRFFDTQKFSDIWYAKNGYERREVQFDKESGYYFVYEREGYRGLFYVFSKPPESELPSDKADFFIAICSGSSLTELKHVRCKSQLLFKPDLAVDFSVPLENLKVQSQVVAFLKERFSEWMN